MFRRSLLALAALGLATLVVACAGSATPAPGAAAGEAAEPLPPTTPETEETLEDLLPTPTPAAGEPTGQASPPAGNITEGCVTDYAEGVDYFPDKVSIEYSAAFTVEYFDNYKVVTVLTPWPGAEESFQYVLVQCGTPAPQQGYPDATVLEVPASSIVTMSTSYITNLDDLGLLEDRLVGLDTGAYVSNPKVRALLAAGQLTEIAPGSQLNVEAALDLNPDLIMTYSAGLPEYDTHPALIQAGLPVVMNADWMEQSPLARAEWVKFMALFFNAEARAEEVFNAIAARYEQAASLTTGIEERPTVLSDTPFEGTWYVPGGQSFTAHLFADAGADYLWAEDESTGTLFLDFETVFERGRDADYWVNIWGYESLADMLSVDERFADFKAFQEGNVYGNDARRTEAGTEIWETGVAHPDMWLLDLIKIFHPELAPDHELYYYRLMPPQ